MVVVAVCLALALQAPSGLVLWEALVGRLRRWVAVVRGALAGRLALDPSGPMPALLAGWVAVLVRWVAVLVGLVLVRQVPSTLVLASRVPVRRALARLSELSLSRSPSVHGPAMRRRGLGL